jgi:hypothetical protein
MQLMGKWLSVMAMLRESDQFNKWTAENLKVVVLSV